jgi:uncharacterized protein
MKKLFEVFESDKSIYNSELRDFLPDKIIDAHTHLWLNSHFINDYNEPSRTVKWPSMVASENSAEDLIETYRLLFPGKKVTPLVFTQAGRSHDFNAGNQYVRESSEKYGFPSLMFATPDLSSDEFEEKIEKNGYLGCKVYLTFSETYIPEKEIRIYDFIPPHQLDILNKRGWILMLHIPRDGRLKDPVNLAQMMEIDKKYPHAHVIIAHVGRAYCDEDIGDAFNVLSKSKNLFFDISANSNSFVFTELIKSIGTKRILFGSDLPILRMRTKRICENGKYINLVAKGTYGDVSVDPHMREIEGSEADKLTFFMYEELLAFKKASESMNLNVSAIEDVFYNNSKDIIMSAGGSI